MRWNYSTEPHSLVSITAEGAGAFPPYGVCGEIGFDWFYLVHEMHPTV
jgi:hypothetical protein